MADPELTFDLTWEEQKADTDPTWGRLCVKLGDEVLWGRKTADGSEGVRWTWGELAEHLAEVWSWLVLENGWPAGPVVRDPKTFLAISQEWLDSMDADEAAENENMMFEFRHRHDLAMGVQGKLLPQLWVVREGLRAWVVGKTSGALLSSELVFEALEGVVEKVVRRTASSTDERWTDLANAWQRRMDRSSSELAAIAVGVSTGELSELADGDVSGTFEIDPQQAPDAFSSNELLAAARMSVPTTDASVVKAIIACMRAAPKVQTPELDQMAVNAQSVLGAGNGDTKPALVGYRMARWLRQRLNIGPDERVEPRTLLAQWNVKIDELGIDDENIEAVACWGPSHGPIILVNPHGRHSCEEPGRRATLAHEITHLLLDRTAALPLAEVIGGNVFRPVEQRAGAFAAELLVPMEVAGRAFQKGTDVLGVLKTLQQHYGVSAELVAWQAYNSKYAMSWPTFSVLRKQVSRPDRFLWTVGSGGRK